MSTEQSVAYPSPMKDDDLLIAIRDAMLAHLNDCAAVDYAAEAALRAIEASGYLVVKPDNWTLCADGRFVNKTENRAEAIRFILKDGDDSGFAEVLEIPRTRADLLAELAALEATK